MSISTTSKNKSKKSNLYREKMASLREFHQATLDHIDESTAYFYPKMAYKPVGLDEVCIGFFPSELSKGTDIYTEFCSRDYESEDPERTLWKYQFNPHWSEEYAKGETSTGSEIYYVPVGELVKIAVQQGKKQNKSIKLGICGEHGGDPKSIEFCSKAGLNYVSCSPYRVPVARLAAAQSEIQKKN